MQPKKNFNTFLWKWSFWRNSTVALSKDSMSSSKSRFLLKWSVQSLSNGSLYVSVKFNFAETSPGFPCRFIFFSSFLFSCSLSESSLSILSELSSCASSSPSWVTLIFIFSQFLLTHLGRLVIFEMQVCLPPLGCLNFL